MEHIKEKNLDTLKSCLEQESFDIESLAIIHNDCNFSLTTLILKCSSMLSEFAFGGITQLSTEKDDDQTQNHITLFLFPLKLCKTSL